MTAKISLTRPLNRSRLYQEIEEVLMRDILDGRIAPGEKLPTERALAHDLDVNRSTVRAALARLEGLDLIEIRHGDGAYVRDFLESGNLDLLRYLLLRGKGFDAGVLGGMLEVRRIVVPEMAARAALHRSEAHLKELKEAVSGLPGLSMLERDILVHHLIAKASGNILYLILLNFFNKFMREFGFLYFEDPRNVQRSETFHRDIYQALAERRPEEARRIMAEVLGYAEEAIRDYLDQSAPKGEPA